MVSALKHTNTEGSLCKRIRWLRLHCCTTSGKMQDYHVWFDFFCSCCFTQTFRYINLLQHTDTGNTRQVNLMGSPALRLNCLRIQWPRYSGSPGREKLGWQVNHWTNRNIFQRKLTGLNQLLNYCSHEWLFFFSFLFRFQQKPLNAASIKNEKIISCKGCQCAIYKDQTLSLQNLLNPTETLLLWQKCPQHNQSEETNQIMWHWSKLSPIYELRWLVYNVGSQLNLYNSTCFVILYSSFLLLYIILLLISLSRVSLWIP